MNSDGVSVHTGCTHGDNHIKIVVEWGLLLKFGISEFLSTGLWMQFLIGKNISDMLVNGRRGLPMKTNLGKACLALCLPCHYYGPVGSKSAVFALRGAAGWTCRYTSTFETGKSGFFRGQPVDATGDLWDAYDNGLSNAYFILKARAMGFDTLIMGMRNADAIRALFEIPENETVLAVIALGYRAQDPKTPTHRPLDEVVKFY